jgi:regulator of sigma E protease
MSIVGILFAVLGLSFLIFIHELGHYLMAKRAGMKIEVFSIGMGKPIISWKQNGVKWQICYLLFGGYVRIAGMEGENGKEPYQVKGGFYSKKPIYRLLVAGAGPLVNIVFALFLFSVVYFAGGQMKPFSGHTKVIGTVDKGSQISEAGITAGDTIISVDDKEYGGFKDILMQGMLKHKNSVKVVFGHQGEEIVEEKVRLYSPEKNLATKQWPAEWRSMGVLSPANYVISNGFVPGEEEFAPLKDSGISKNDRIVYVDGVTIYSLSQLSDVIGNDIALVTVLRDGKKLHMQVPRIALGDLKLTDEQKNEFIDSKREMNLEGALASTQFIPFLVSEGLYVEDELSLIDDEPFVTEDSSLRKGDKILAVSGINVSTPAEFYAAISSRKCVVIVSNMGDGSTLSLDNDAVFLGGLDRQIIAGMESSLGAEKKISASGYRFLNVVEPISHKQYLEKANPEHIALYKKKYDKEDFDHIMSKHTLFSGTLLKDKEVVYNPHPFAVAGDIMSEMVFSFKGLFTGSISPKHMSGPVGMVKIVHDGSKGSLLTGVYWLGLISLNLGLMNLLPLPVLDGGHICFTLYEVITKKRIKAKTMQKMMMPFIFLLIFFFAYVTFYDVIKVFS